MTDAAVVYPGKDLEAMSFAVKYHRWLLGEFSQFIGKRVVEVGAGTGSFSEMLLEMDPDSLSLVEPSEMFEQLEKNVAANGNKTVIDLYNSIFEDVAEKITASKPDTIIYVNVLEHVEDDERELALIHRSLVDGGRCLIFVPAMRSLFSEFDRDIGHFRRYQKRELETKAGNAGFKVIKSQYFDFAGILPWFVKYRLLRSRTMGGGAVSAYDDLVVPVMSRVESLMKPPIGKNVLMVAEKRS